MSISSVIIQNFKSLVDVRITGLEKQLYMIVGANGSGKSCFLEAILFCLGYPVTQLRARATVDLIRRSGAVRERRMLVTLTMNSGAGIYTTVDVTVSSSETETKLVRRLDGRTVTLSDLRLALGTMGLDPLSFPFAIKQGSVTSLAACDPHQLYQWMAAAAGQRIWAETSSSISKQLTTVEAHLVKGKQVVEQFTRARTRYVEAQTLKKRRAECARLCDELESMIQNLHKEKEHIEYLRAADMQHKRKSNYLESKRLACILTSEKALLSECEERLADTIKKNSEERHHKAVLISEMDRFETMKEQYAQIVERKKQLDAMSILDLKREVDDIHDGIKRKTEQLHVMRQIASSNNARDEAINVLHKTRDSLTSLSLSMRAKLPVKPVHSVDFIRDQLLNLRSALSSSRKAKGQLNRIRSQLKGFPAAVLCDVLRVPDEEVSSALASVMSPFLVLVRDHSIAVEAIRRIEDAKCRQVTFQRCDNHIPPSEDSLRMTNPNISYLIDKIQILPHHSLPEDAIYNALNQLIGNVALVETGCQNIPTLLQDVPRVVTCDGTVHTRSTVFCTGRRWLHGNHEYLMKEISKWETMLDQHSQHTEAVRETEKAAIDYQRLETQRQQLEAFIASCKETEMECSFLPQLERDLNQELLVFETKKNELATCMIEQEENQNELKYLSSAMTEFDFESHKTSLSASEEVLQSIEQEMASLRSAILCHESTIADVRERLASVSIDIDLSEEDLDSSETESDFELREQLVCRDITDIETNIVAINSQLECAFEDLHRIDAEYAEACQELEKMPFDSEQLDDLTTEFCALDEELDRLKRTKTTVDIELSSRITELCDYLSERVPAWCSQFLPHTNITVEYSQSEETLTIFAFENGKSIPISRLSGGQRTLISVIFTLAILEMSPGSFLLLDEPDAALDEANQARLVTLLKHMLIGRMVLVVSHHESTLQSQGTQIVVKEGHISSKTYETVK